MKQIGARPTLRPNPNTLFTGKPGTEETKSSQGQVMDRAAPRPWVPRKVRADIYAAGYQVTA